MATSPQYRGWKYDKANSRLNAEYNADPSLYIDASGVTVPSGETLTVGGTLTTTGAVSATGKATLSNFSFGTAETVTIATGVATITKSYVILDAEGAGTTDQLDTLTKADAAAGDVVLLTVNATDTITVDDANINLGAATRAIAPGGSLLVYYDGTQWTELAFLTASDNV